METISVATPGIDLWVLVVLSVAVIVLIIGLILHFSKWKDSDNKTKKKLGELNGVLIAWGIITLISFSGLAASRLEEGLISAKLEALEGQGYTRIIATGDNSFVASDDGTYVTIDLLDEGDNNYTVVVQIPD